MDNFICKVADREELLKRWEYMISNHPGKNEWIRYRDNAIRNFDSGSSIPYIGILNGEIICEATAYIKESAFEGDINDPSGLLSDNMAYLAAFRTNKDYEGKGYFSKLYNFMEIDLKQRGYTELCLGVRAYAVRNMEIYFHLGFRDYIKTLIKQDPVTQEEDVTIFYKKSN